MLTVAVWQVGMMRTPGVWALARRSASGGRELICAGVARHNAAFEAPRSTRWKAALAAGADEFLLLPEVVVETTRRETEVRDAA